MRARLCQQAGLKGLKNLGNTCFMNAALQSLSNTVPLTDYFLGHEWRAELNGDNFLGHGGRLAEAYGALLDELWTHSGDDSGSVVSPKSFKQVLSSCNEMFDGYEQHDTQEMLTFLLDGLHEDLNRVKHRPVVNQVDNRDDERDEEAVACEAWLGYLKRNRSIIVDLFQGQLRSVLTCKACGHKTATFDPFQYLSVPLRSSSGRAISVQECIEHFCDEEMLDDYSCSKCKRSHCVTKRLALWKLPPLLIIHLKRFAFNPSGRASKIASEVSFPLEDLDLSEMCPSYQRDRPLFDCYAFTCHHGGFGSGHYTATCRTRTKPDQWFRYDDARVTEMSDAEVRRAFPLGRACMSEASTQGWFA